MSNSELRRAAWRIGLQTAFLVLTCVVLVGITVFVVADRSAANEGEQAVRSASANVDKPQEAPRGVSVVVERAGRRLSSPDLPEGFPLEDDMTAVRETGKTREHLVKQGHDRYLVRTERVGDRVNQAIYDQEEYEAERHRLEVALFSAGGLGVLLSALAGVLLAWRSLQPLAQSLAMQRRFVADASHELRTPLTLLSTRVQLLARQLRRGHTPAPGEVEGVLSDTHRLGEILDDLLAAADTRSSVAHDEVDVGVVVAEAVASAAASAQELGKELTVSREDQAVVRGSESSLRRAVIALVDNALDHATSAVTVDVRAERGTCAVAVSDDGPGIDPEVLPRMFERFASSREATSLRRHYGLGLALVADVADAHGGKVAAAPRPDGPGAVLTLTLPLA
ncbi:MAG TPA: HAMP domain-containing sensor histidine kinase [Marmoricola sp.]|nr:HAMP domain-containing sensor histidine kinase [Marmoricola sp.]